VTPTTNEGTAAPRSPSWGRWALAAALILSVVAFYATGLNQYFSWDFIRGHVDSLKAWVSDNISAAILICFVVYVAVTALSLPAAAILSLLVGALFGVWIGTCLVNLAATLGATLAFLSSRYLFRDWVQRRFGQRLEPLNRGVEKDGAYYLFTLRLVPIFPFFLINLGMGLTRMPVRTFAGISLLGMLPGTVLYVFAGQELSRIESPRDILSPGILVALALLGIFPLLVRKLIQWRKK
jgi:uncharacterized membrane protein YdjX (TVP38/TMEM64 family)